MTAEQIRKIRKSGNSYVLTIPPAIMDSLGLKEGDMISFTINNNSIELV